MARSVDRRARCTVGDHDRSTERGPRGRSSLRPSAQARLGGPDQDRSHAGTSLRCSHGWVGVLREHRCGRCRSNAGPVQVRCRAMRRRRRQTSGWVARPVHRSHRGDQAVTLRTPMAAACMGGVVRVVDRAGSTWNRTAIGRCGMLFNMFHVERRARRRAALCTAAPGRSSCTWPTESARPARSAREVFADRASCSVTSAGGAPPLLVLPSFRGWCSTWNNGQPDP